MGDLIDIDKHEVILSSLLTIWIRRRPSPFYDQLLTAIGKKIHKGEESSVEKIFRMCGQLKKWDFEKNAEWNSDRSNILHYAVFFGDISKVEKVGAFSDDNIIIYTCLSGQIDILKKLNPQIYDSFIFYTCLHIACDLGYKEIISHLVSIRKPSAEQLFPILNLAYKHRNYEIIEILLKELDFICVNKSVFNKDQLHCLIKNIITSDDYRFLQLILTQVPNIFEKLKQAELKPHEIFELAMENKNYIVAELLINADILKFIENENGNVYSEFKFWQLLKDILQSNNISFIKTVLNKEPFLFRKYISNVIADHHIPEETLSLFLPESIDDPIKPEGSSSLAWAVAIGRSDRIDFFLKRKARIHTPLQTPLYYVVIQQDIDYLKNSLIRKILIGLSKAASLISNLLKGK